VLIRFSVGAGSLAKNDDAVCLPHCVIVLRWQASSYRIFDKPCRSWLASECA